MKVSSQAHDFSNNFLLLRKFRIEKNTVTPPTCDCDEPLKLEYVDGYAYVFSCSDHESSNSWNGVQ